jgi:hypothetical protein
MSIPTLGENNAMTEATRSYTPTPNGISGMICSIRPGWRCKTSPRRPLFTSAPPEDDEVTNSRLIDVNRH